MAAHTGTFGLMDARPFLRIAVTVVAAVVVCCGRGGDEPAHPYGARPTDGLPPPAEPAAAPPQHDRLDGQIIPVGRSPEGVVVDAATRTVAVAVDDPDELVTIDADSGAVIGRTPLPGSARHVALAATGGPILVPVETANALVRVDLPDGHAQPAISTGVSPHDAAAASNGVVFVANEGGGTVAVVRGDYVVKVFNDRVQPAGTAAVYTAVGLLDVRKNDLTVYDAEALTSVGSVPAGQGPTHLVSDRHERMIAVDTRGNAIRVFDLTPGPRQVASVAQPGAPYGITYDPARDRLWVASSGTNEVVGYDMTGTAPRQVRRFSTVQNPYSVGVDAATGKLFVAGASEGVVHVINPQIS
jgi:DNA-binding beta-propeller fold protein YncE